MSELSIFEFEGQEIKVFGSTEHPEWLVADVGAVLGISHSTLSERVSKMPESWKGVVRFNRNGSEVHVGSTDTNKSEVHIGSTDMSKDEMPDAQVRMYSIHTNKVNKGERQMLTVTEPGLYELIFRSDKPVAQRFRVWMFEEVLPSIRRTGSYSHSTPQQVPDPQISQLIELAQTQIEVINEQQKMLATALADLSKAKDKGKKQPKWTPRNTSHLMEFVREVGLEPQPDGRVYISDLWQQLQNWYIKTGVLRVEIVKGKEKLTWQDLTNKGDCPVKAINQLSRRFREIFPHAQKHRSMERAVLERRGCHYLTGIGYAQSFSLSQIMGGDNE
jgi:prophage antirepressor-like protein